MVRAVASGALWRGAPLDGAGEQTTWPANALAGNATRIQNPLGRCHELVSALAHRCAVTRTIAHIRVPCGANAAIMPLLLHRHTQQPLKCVRRHIDVVTADTIMCTQALRQEAFEMTDK